MNGQNSIARQFAMTILFIAFLGSGISLSIWFTGNEALALQVCGFSVLIGLVVLIFGGIFVARSRT
jgi:hypothetical protein